MQFSFFLFAISTNAQSQEQFETLKVALNRFITSVPQLAIRTFVRMSFHDLGNIDPANPSIQGGPHGCLRESRILGFNENGNLGRSVSNLVMNVENAILGHNISYGDIFAFAGKLAVEAAYPCIRIPFQFGRPKCSDQEKSGQQSMLPGGKINSIEVYKPFLNRYGFSAEDFAILLMGAHGIQSATASSITSGFAGTFATITNGKDFIKKTLETNWKSQIQTFPSNNIQYVSNGTTANVIMRLPSDMVFFPSIQSAIPGAEAADLEATPVEDRLKQLAAQPRSSFDKEFARVYTKMLNIGVDASTLTTFVEEGPADQCME
jgi:catalase (peroxidase I)